MRLLVEDSWINDCAIDHSLSDIEDCAIAIDATYWLIQLLDDEGAEEPLLPALGGLANIETQIGLQLQHFEDNKIIPLFVFDGQALVGQDEVALKRSTATHKATDEAWTLYAKGLPVEAVDTFRPSNGAYNVRNLYPALQRHLKARDLHFLVAPYNACAQLAYFEMVDSDQCAGVMGPQDLLAYPIRDSVIRKINWERQRLSAVSKNQLKRSLGGVSEAMFVDALLMAGTSFLEPFPPFSDATTYPRGSDTRICDAVNILRTSDKSVANACAAFSDHLQSQDAEWLSKYRMARMAVHHFIHITEDGEVRVNEYDKLTQDNHQYLGLQLPAELFHYLNTGLIGPRNLSCITHGQFMIQPSLDSVITDEYKKLVTEEIVPIREQTLGLIIPRVHRGIGHKAVTMRAWFDPKFTHNINHSNLSPPPSQKVGTWDVKEKDLRAHFPPEYNGPIFLEITSLLNDEFAAKTIAKTKNITGIDSTDMVISVTIWRFLHLRGYINDQHRVTEWGRALALALFAIRDSNGDQPSPKSEEAVLLAFELIRHGLLGGKPRVSAVGYPRKGTDEEKASLALVSECASLLRLSHQEYGYTGPLNRGLLAFRALSSTVRQADRDLIEAILASMFMYGQSKRERSDQVEISTTLPFSDEPDISLGIAVRTFFDDDEGAKPSKEQRLASIEEFVPVYAPFAQDLAEDFRTVAAFIGAINTGIQSLEEIKVDKTAWSRAQAYMDARPL